jgi:hypothetical protein
LGKTTLINTPFSTELSPAKTTSFPLHQKWLRRQVSSNFSIVLTHDQFTDIKWPQHSILGMLKPDVKNANFEKKLDV